MVVGHRRNLDYLRRVLEKGTMAHAYLFYGPEAVGKKTVAFEFAKSIFCREGSGRPFGGCGLCQDCREVGAMAHPDLLFLSRERPLADEDLKREIGLKNIYELRRVLGMTPWRGGRRVVIIDGAEALSGEAQSALLKILEEPPPGTVFILVSASAKSVYPTIRSRSVPLSFSLAADDDMRPLLGDLSAKEHRRFLDLAEGRPGVLARLIGDKKFFEEFQGEALRFRKVIESDMPSQLAFSEKEAREPGRVESLLNFMVRHFYRKFQAALEKSGESFTAPDRFAISGLAEFLRTVGAKLSIVETVAVNRRLISDSVFLELQTLRAD